VAIGDATRNRHGHARSHGNWLAWLEQAGQLGPDEGPGQRPAPARIAGWVRAMREAQRKNGVMKLRRMRLHAILARLAPGTDTGFILRPGGKSSHEVFPVEPKAFSSQDSGELLERANARCAGSPWAGRLGCLLAPIAAGKGPRRCTR
jgi:hypothetical protein